LVSCNKSTKDSNVSENIIVEKTITGSPDSVPPPPPPPPPPTSNITPPSPPALENSSNDKVYKIVEEMPSYPGGDEARIKFLVDNFVYPTSAKEKGIQGTVYVTFIVGEDGAVSNVKVLRGIGGGCDEEAVRIMKMMPKWNPGKQDGKNVSVQYNLPIKFKLH
jgi:periplasmic protein TonB